MRSLLIIALTFAVAGCTLDRLKRVEPKGNAFAVSLAKQYRDFSESEADQYDWVDSQHFANKGMDAAYGKIPQPEELKDWNLPANMVPTLTDARAQLIAALTDGNITSRPDITARAQTMFDCWVEQQEENWQPEHIAACRDGFYDALNMLSASPQEVKVEKPIEFKEPANKSEQVETSYVIFFALNSTALTKEGESVVKDIYNELSDDTDYVIRLEGHADKSGTAAYNKELSRRRAAVVKNALEKKGLRNGKFTVLAHGEEMPLIQTADGVKEKANRRVEIFINE